MVHQILRAGVEAEPGRFNGLECLWLSNGLIRLAVTTGRGPRILSWGWRDDTSIFAEVPRMVERTAEGVYEFLGGHRLWYAPEALERTYWPDLAPPEVTTLECGARFAAPPDAAGIARELTCSLAVDRPEARIGHRLTNVGRWPVQLAAWAPTMCRLGGIALLPQPQGRVDAAGLLPNRRFSLWPYSDPADPRLVWGNRLVLVHGRPGPRNKIGYFNDQVWIGYWLKGTLFSKHVGAASPPAGAEYPDFGVTAECFFDDAVVEIESMGPLVTLAPGASVTHDEVWRLHRSDLPVGTEAEALGLTGALGLPPAPPAN